MSRKDRHKKKIKTKGGKPAVVPEIPHAKLQGSYVVTYQPLKDPKSLERPLEVREAIPRFFAKSTVAPREIIPELLDMIERFPDIPVLYNYLVNAYKAIGDLPKSDSLTIQLHRQFPDYLFGRANYAIQLLESRQIERAGEVLDGKFSVGELYPDRKIFHVSEITAFNYPAGLYLALKGRHGEARKVFLELLSVAPNFPITKILAEALHEMHAFDDVKEGSQELRDLIQAGYTPFPKELLASLPASLRAKLTSLTSRN
jgi:tetratricopeptide (TPR) repeat protein